LRAVRPAKVPRRRVDWRPRAIGLYKTELIKRRGPWKNLTGVELATAEYVDWYNTTRLHGEIGHIPPDEYEARYFQNHTEPQVTATT
jgi:putative transposase